MRAHPAAADDVHERASHGAKAAAQIKREPLSAEHRDSLQKPSCSTSARIHRTAECDLWSCLVMATLSDRSGESYVALGIRQNLENMGLHLRDCPG